MSMTTLFAIGAGGFLGAILRAYLNGTISSMLPHTLPFGTLSVNLIGSFIIGILFALFMHTTAFSTPMKSFLSTGFLGALTTYSTFAYESFLLLHSGAYFYALINMSLNLFGTIFLAGSGYLLIQFLFQSSSQ